MGVHNHDLYFGLPPAIVLDLGIENLSYYNLISRTGAMLAWY